MKNLENLKNEILIGDKESMIKGLTLNKFIILDSYATFITNITAKLLYIRNSSFIAIKDCVIDKIEVVNSQHCLFHGNIIKEMNTRHELPMLRGIFSKRRNHKLIDQYGSNYNTIIANIVTNDINEKEMSNNNITVLKND